MLTWLDMAGMGLREDMVTGCELSDSRIRLDVGCVPRSSTVQETEAGTSVTVYERHG